MGFDAPYHVTGLHVKEEWIDYNGHLNMAFYHVLFDNAVDIAFAEFGMGPDYVTERGASFYTMEAHINYLREIHLNDPLRVSLHLLDYDAKRVHYFMEMFHEKDGWLAATTEHLCMHVDMTEKRSSPFPDDVVAKIAEMHEAHKDLPRADNVGRVIGIKRK